MKASVATAYPEDGSSSAAAVGEGTQVVAALHTYLAGTHQIWNQSCSPGQNPFRPPIKDVGRRIQVSIWLSVYEYTT
jgi:hypothetical protein